MSKQTGRVLRRKLGAIRSRGYRFPLQSRLAEVLEFAAAKGAGTALGVPVEATVTDSRVQPLARLVDELPAPGLFAVLEAAPPGDGGRRDAGPTGPTGLIGLETRLVDHLVELLSGGEPDNWEAGPPGSPPRSPTVLDAALCKQVVREIMANLHAGVRALAGEVDLAPLVPGRVEHAPASLPYLLPDRKYLVLKGNLDIGDGPRSGDFQLALPLGWLEPVEEVVRRMGVASARGESEHWQRHMREVVQVTPLPLLAVIDRCRMSVAELSRLKVGEMFVLPGSTLDDVTLELDAGGERRRVAKGRLGASKRSKAVRLAEPPDRELLAPLAAVLELSPERLGEEGPEDWPERRE